MKNKKIIIAIIILISTVVFLIASGIRSTKIYYKSVSDAAATEDNSEFRIEGEVVKNSTLWNPEKTLLKFKMTDGKQKINVIYKGYKPDTYKEGKGVIVEGKYFSKSNTLKADTLLTKCPSKYEKKEEEN